MSAHDERRPDLGAVREYLSRENPKHINAADPARVKVAKHLVPHRIREPARVQLTRAARPVMRRKLERLRLRSPLKLNLGSGYRPLESFVNIDLVGAPVDLAWNILDGIPFADGTVDAVLSEHVLEHVTLPQGQRVLQEAFRVLRPGGILRVAVPDAGLLLRSYAGTSNHDWAHAFPTRMLAVNALFYGHGHRTMYDDTLMVSQFEIAGFDEVATRHAGDSGISPVSGSPSRAEGSLYVEGVKPQTRAVD
jgi:predicted SAM-dependent methyltransferase